MKSEVKKSIKSAKEKSLEIENISSSVTSESESELESESEPEASMGASQMKSSRAETTKYSDSLSQLRLDSSRKLMEKQFDR